MALVALVTAITITAIIRYDVDSVLKIWSSLGTVVGVVTGAVVTYFFTRDAVDAAKKRRMEPCENNECADESWRHSVALPSESAPSNIDGTAALREPSSRQFFATLSIFESSLTAARPTSA
jgi:hypothetical protein